MTKPLVALVGRPNVGKSTLFNRLIEEPLAIVEDVPGTTRDRIYADAEWGGRALTLIDTGGLFPDSTGDLVASVRDQVEIAIAEAEVIIFMVDVKEGLTASDLEIAQLLRRSNKPVLLAVNKADNESRRRAAVEFHELGLGDLYPISALHGTGTGDLLDALLHVLPPRQPEESAEGIKVAIVGRPNVGKSSLLNAILGQERMIVSEKPGTTRDAVDSFIEWDGQPVTLIDTAGIRRRGRVAAGIERYSVIRALRAVQRADVVLLLIDAVDGVTAQDAHITGYILDEAKGIVVVVNKWDLVQKDSYTMEQYSRQIRRALKFVSYSPLVFASAITGQRVGKAMDVALRVQRARSVRVPTAELNKLMRDAVSRHSPPSKRGRRLRIYYATQVGVAPPSFVLFVNDPQLVHFTYHRYLQNQLREAIGFEGSPLRLTFRKRA
ncbi:MAG: ribosome biogenesis GTPase Der [Chloroflexi bacterium B3_Chlor]|nr:MAG: ribosome biogenesis GTPase Der [Chloroflexi bacterium B3_Chlor]